ncbi:MAG: PAS domain-containing protein [Nitrospirae bacterium]|nr:PAS domain-containing protein [Nitrospirota bacterium]
MTNEPGPLKKFQRALFRKWLTGSFLLISLSILLVILFGGRFFGIPFSQLENHQLLLLVFFSAVAVSILAGLLFSRRLTASLNLLREGIHRIGKGDFNFRVRLRDSDEFEELGKGFNEMAGKLALGWKEISEDRAKLSAILNGMIEGILILNGEGKVLLVNPALRRMFSLALSLPEGIYYYELLRHRELNEFVREILFSRQNLSFEISFTGQQESFFQVQASVASVENYAGEICIVLVFHEITDIKRLERVRKDFVANVSHELRTPLTSIKGYLEALQDLAPGIPDEGQKFLNILLKHARGMENIVSDLLHLARIESGKEKLQLAPISLKSFLLKTVQELSPLAEKKNQTMEAHGGFIKVESEINRGTTFTAVFPLSSPPRQTPS